MNENNRLPDGWGDAEDEEYEFPQEADSPWGKNERTADVETAGTSSDSLPAERIVQQDIPPRKKSLAVLFAVIAAFLLVGAGGVGGGLLLSHRPEKETESSHETENSTETMAEISTESVVSETVQTAVSETDASNTETVDTAPSESVTETVQITATEPVKLTFAQEYVNAVLKNEATWRSVLGKGNNECWFQDLDMDGVPEFIAGGYLFSNGKFQYVAFHPYYFENGELQPMSNGSDALQLLFDAGQSSGGQDGFACQLFKDRQSGSFSYMYQSVDVTGRSISYYLNRIPCHYTHALSFDTLLTLEYDGEYSYGGMDSTMTREQFLTAYDSIFEENVYYKTYIKPVSCSAISFDALLNSYEAWAYEKGTASTLPLADVVSDVRNYQEEVPTTEMPTEIIQEIPPKTEYSANLPTINAWIETRTIPVDDDGDGIYEAVADGCDLYLCVSGDFDSYYYEFYMAEPDGNNPSLCNSGTISSSEIYLTSGSGGFAVIVGLVPIAADGTQGEAVYATLVL